MAKPRKIILAESNYADFELTKTSFGEVNLPLEVVQVADGQELLNLLRVESLDNIAFVMMSLSLPRIDGFEVLKTMYHDEELRKLPVIVFNDSMNKEDILESYEQGANAYVKKPVDINEFKDTIQAIAHFWGDINVLPSYNSHPV